MISRTSLLAGIEELKESPWYNFGKMDPNTTRHEYMEAMWYYGYLQRKEAVEIIEDICIKKEPAVLADSGWISVKDRLPRVFKNVLTIDSKGKIRINWLENIIGMKGYFAYDSGSVTHWQPLPEPPKEDKDETN